MYSILSRRQTQLPQLYDGPLTGAGFQNHEPSPLIKTEKATLGWHKCSQAPLQCMSCSWAPRFRFNAGLFTVDE